MPNPYDNSKVFSKSSKYFECGQTFFAIAKCEILLNILACLSMVKDIFPHLNYFGHVQKYFELANGLDIRLHLHHRLWTPGEGIAFTARPKIKSQPQIYAFIECP